MQAQRAFLASILMTLRQAATRGWMVGTTWGLRLDATVSLVRQIRWACQILGRWAGGRGTATALAGPGLAAQEWAGLALGAAAAASLADVFRSQGKNSARMSSERVCTLSV